MVYGFICNPKLEINPANESVKKEAISIIEKSQKDFMLKIDNISHDLKIKHIIVDLSCVNFIDTQGINCLIQVNNLYKIS